MNCRAKANVVIKDPKRAARRLVRSVQFVRHFDPRVVNVNPFVPRPGAPFTKSPSKDVRRALQLLSVFQLVRPRTLVPTAATLTALTTSKHRQKVLTKTGMIVPGLSPRRMEKGCRLCGGGTSLNTRTTRKLTTLSRRLSTVDCEVIASEKSFKGCGLWVVRPYVR